MVSLIPGSGCIDSSSEPVKEAKLDEVTDSQDTSSNTTVETAHEENFSEESKATLESEKKALFSDIIVKEAYSLRQMFLLILCL
nr:hypothetical protein [Methanosarcina mazei]